MKPTKSALQQQTAYYEDGFEGIEVTPRWWVRAGLLVGAVGTALVAAGGLAMMLHIFVATERAGELWGPLAVLPAMVGVGLLPYMTLRMSWECTETHLFHPEGYWASRIHGWDTTYYPHAELGYVQVEASRGFDANEDVCSYYWIFTPAIRTTRPGRSGTLPLHMYERAWPTSAEYWSFPLDNEPLQGAQASASEIARVLGVPCKEGVRIRPRPT